MNDREIARLAGRQFNRIARRQMYEHGVSDNEIARRLEQGRLVIAEHGVLAFAPLLAHDPWGSWMAATLTAPGTVLSGVSAATARGFWDRRRDVETVTRSGSGGPRRYWSVLVSYSSTLEDDIEMLRGIPITAPPRTLLDLAASSISTRALARSVREAVRLRTTTTYAIADRLGSGRGRRGTRRLAGVLSRYAGLPLDRARSGAEIRAIEILRDAGTKLPGLNVRIAGEEADLTWPKARLILEIDGGPFHLDVGEDARKQAIWEDAGWTVRRISADVVYEDPQAVLAAVAGANVRN